MTGQRTQNRWWIYVPLTVALIAVIAPFVWMVLGSFKGTISGTATDMTMTEYDPAARYTAFTPPPGAVTRDRR